MLREGQANTTTRASTASRATTLFPVQLLFNNTRAFWSIANARRVIGYDPQDDSEIKYAADIRRLLVDDAHTGRVGAD